MFSNTKIKADILNETAASYGQDKILVEAVCLSTDTKPTDGIANGSVCLEMNTGKVFVFNEAGSAWVELQ